MSPRTNATRAELEAAAVDCSTQANDPKRSTGERAQASADAQQLRARLNAGDFRVGDRIVVHLTGGAVLVDTLTVSPERVVRIADAGDVSLDGVLRSELEPRLNAELAKYIRNVEVRAQPLTRLAVLGEVRNPGFIHVPSQALLSDVISAAGGPTPNGRLDRAEIRRAGETLVSHDSFAKGLAAGATLDDLGVRPGDEIFVGARRSSNLTQMLQTTAVLVGSAATIFAIQHR